MRNGALRRSRRAKGFFHLRRIERLERLERFELPDQIGSQEVVRILIFLCRNTERKFLAVRRVVTEALLLRPRLVLGGRIKPWRR